MDKNSDKVCCFGELLLRLSPVLQGQWINQSSLSVYLGGAELNVATALAKWKHPVRYFSALPDNYLSEEICTAVAAKNIDVSTILFTGKRIGTYYLPQGADMKNAGVIYDREGSSFASLVPGMLNWDAILEGISWFHFTAIDPALSESAAAVCLEGLQAASAKSINISVDLNYRAKLWQYGKKPPEIMPKLVQYCDVVMGNIWAANSLLGLPVDDQIHLTGSKEDFLAHATKTSEAIMHEYPKCKTVANTFRFDKGDKGIQYFATLNTGGNQYTSTEKNALEIVDKVGSGDCFMAALIYALIHHYSSQEVIELAATAAFGKLMEKGDVTNQEIETIIKKAGI